MYFPVFLSNEYYPKQLKQNIFFLHGAFHIYTNKKRKIYKIIQTQDKALYQKLEEIINSEEEDIVCVLTGESNEKEKQIRIRLLRG